MKSILMLVTICVYFIQFTHAKEKKLTDEIKKSEEKRIQEIYDGVWESAVREFSPYLQPFPNKPQILIEDISEHGPHYNPMNQEILFPLPYLKLDNKAIKSIIAHELIHHFSNTFNYLSTSHLNTADLSVDSICDSYNNPAEDLSSALENIITHLKELQGQGLILDLKTTQGISQYIQPQTDTELVMNKMLNELKSKSEVCGEADKNYRKITDIFTKSCTKTLIDLGECRFSGKTKKELPSLLKTFDDLGRRCFAGEEDLFSSLMSETNGYNPLSLALADPSKERIVNSIGTNPFDKLLALNMYDILKLDSLSQKFKENKITHFSIEDEADVLAQVIFSEYSLDELMLRRKVLRKCDRVISAGKTPNYGLLSDDHHSTCWRIYRIEKLKDELKDPIKKDKLLSSIFNPARNKSTVESWQSLGGLDLPPLTMPEDPQGTTLEDLPPLPELPDFGNLPENSN